MDESDPGGLSLKARRQDCRRVFATAEPARMLHCSARMGFIVKIVDGFGNPRGWIGRRVATRAHHFGPRQDAYVFPTEMRAADEIEIVRNSWPNDFNFDIEPVERTSPAWPVH